MSKEKSRKRSKMFWKIIFPILIVSVGVGGMIYYFTKYHLKQKELQKNDVHKDNKK